MIIIMTIINDCLQNIFAEMLHYRPQQCTLTGFFIVTQVSVVKFHTEEEEEDGGSRLKSWVKFKKLFRNYLIIYILYFL